MSHPRLELGPRDCQSSALPLDHSTPWAPPGRGKGSHLTPLDFDINFSHIITVAPRVEIQMHFWKGAKFAGFVGHHHQFHVADEGRRVVAPPCPRSTARLQRSPIRRVESFRSWSTHLFRGRPGGRRHVRSGGRLSDTLMWS